LAAEIPRRYDGRVNYFAHGLRYLDRPYFLAGTAVPDWMSVADRRVRVRPNRAEPLVAGDGPASQVAAGVLQHFHDDQWFHCTRGFLEMSAVLTRTFREVLGGGDDIRAGFLGHITTEMLLDAVLIAGQRERLDAYYDALQSIDPACVEETVNRMARGQTERLAAFIALFVRERFLYDYLESPRMLWRLNQVLRRVKLQPLPDAATSVLDAGRELVAARVPDLLPPQYFGA
jgi:hypothetical protein